MARGRASRGSPRATCLEVARALLLEQQREEVDLEEEVAELVEQLRVVAGERRVGDLVGLLDRVRDDRPRGLLAVPGAVAAEPLGQLPGDRAAPPRGSPRGLSAVGRVGGRAGVVVAGGASPVAYLTLSAYSFFTPSSHFYSASLRFCWSSCWRIASFTCVNGVVLLRRRGLERLDDVPAELRLDRLRELAGLELERDLVEPGTRLAARRSSACRPATSSPGRSSTSSRASRSRRRFLSSCA